MVDGVDERDIMEKSVRVRKEEVKRYPFFIVFDEKVKLELGYEFHPRIVSIPASYSSSKSTLFDSKSICPSVVVPAVLVLFI
jgi:hypothetical protein